MREGLVSLVDAAMEAKALNDLMSSRGYPDNPYWDIFSRIADGISKLIMENKDEFDDTLTARALYAEDKTADQRVDILLGEEKSDPLD